MHATVFVDMHVGRDEAEEEESTRRASAKHTATKVVPKYRLSVRQNAAKVLSDLNLFRGEAKSKPALDIALTCFYAATRAATLVIYTVVVVLSFAHRESVEKWRLEAQSKSEVPSIAITIETACNKPWACYENWGSDDAEFVTATHAYSTPTAKCPGAYAANISTKYAVAELSQRVCYSSVYDDGLDVRIPFNAHANYGPGDSMRVVVTSPDSDMYISIDLEPSQRKTIFIGQELKERRDSGLKNDLLAFFGIGDDEDFEIDKRTARPYQSDLFYDGKNENATALLRIRASQFANVATVGREGSVVDLFAKVGGMHSLAWLAVIRLRAFCTAPHNFLGVVMDCFGDGR